MWKRNPLCPWICVWLRVWTETGPSVSPVSPVMNRVCLSEQKVRLSHRSMTGFKNSLYFYQVEDRDICSLDKKTWASPIFLWVSSKAWGSESLGLNQWDCHTYTSWDLVWASGLQQDPVWRETETLDQSEPHKLLFSISLKQVCCSSWSTLWASFDRITNKKSKSKTKAKDLKKKDSKNYTNNMYRISNLIFFSLE